MLNQDIFYDLFVLEMTNNHLGAKERGIEIIDQHSTVVRSNNIRAAIKFQFRNPDSFIHHEFLRRTDINYIRKVIETLLSKEDYASLINAVQANGCIPMATPFDENSVQWCVDFELPIIKVASVDSSDWPLLKRIAKTRKPVIISTGGAYINDIDEAVKFFENQQIPLALNHCVSTYPNEAYELELHQIDFLKNRYRNHIIGFSSHERGGESESVVIAYSKGARLFERHIDVPNHLGKVSPYSSMPAEIDAWFKAYNKTREMCGTALDERKSISAREQDYIDSHLRGVYAKVDLSKGQILTENDLYLAIPLLKGQLSTKELHLDLYPIKMKASCAQGKPITIDIVDSPFIRSKEYSELINARGI